MKDSVEVFAELETLEDRVDFLIGKWEDRYANLHENYTLLMLLYLYEFHPETPTHGSVRQALAALCSEAAGGHLVNFTSLHRAITAAKKKHQTPEDQARSDNLEVVYRDVLLRPGRDDEPDPWQEGGVWE